MASVEFLSAFRHNFIFSLLHLLTASSLSNAVNASIAFSPTSPVERWLQRRAQRVQQRSCPCRCWTSPWPPEVRLGLTTVSKVMAACRDDLASGCLSPCISVRDTLGDLLPFSFRMDRHTFVCPFQTKLTRSCLHLGRLSTRCSVPRLSEALKTPASGLREQDENRSQDPRPPAGKIGF